MHSGQLLGVLCTDSFDGLHGFGMGADRQLCAETETGAGLAIDAVMGGVTVGEVFLPTHGSDPGGRGIKAPLRLLLDGLVPVYVQFDTDRSRECFVHKSSIAQMFKEAREEEGKEQHACAGGNSSPLMNAEVSLPRRMKGQLRHGDKADSTIILTA